MDHTDAVTIRRALSHVVRLGSLMGATLLVVLLMAACGGEDSAPEPVTTGTAGIAPPQLDPNAAVPAGPGPTRAEVEALGYAYGDSGAPIHVIEMSDFGCGYCKKFHEEVFPVLLEEYVETGKVHWRFIPFDNGMFPNAQGALNAGVCAGELGNIREAGLQLFSRQREWKRAGDVSADLLAIVTDAGVEPAEWSDCIETGVHADKGAAFTRMARRLGVRGTPTFFIDGYPIQGALPLETFREVFESVLTERATAESE